MVAGNIHVFPEVKAVRMVSLYTRIQMQPCASVSLRFFGEPAEHTFSEVSGTNRPVGNQIVPVEAYRMPGPLRLGTQPRSGPVPPRTRRRAGSHLSSPCVGRYRGSLPFLGVAGADSSRENCLDLLVRIELPNLHCHQFFQALPRRSSRGYRTLRGEPAARRAARALRGLAG